MVPPESHLNLHVDIKLHEDFDDLYVAILTGCLEGCVTSKHAIHLKYIPATPHEHYGVSKHRQSDY